ncbi:MAG: PDZ domain-containing protein [Anaerolineales bacterium]|nr:PDZ domain-containing protein [Anaerolineales bacterium]
MRRETIITAIITLVSLGIAFAAGWYTHQMISPPELDLPVLSQAKQIILNHSYYPIPEDPALEHGMIQGMVGALDDPYASFSEPVQHELSSDNFAGHFGGIGSQLSYNEEGLIVLYPNADSPAREAGLIDGDILVGVDDALITIEMDIHEAVALIRGPEGEKVQITIQRPPEMEEYSFEIKRARIDLPSVSSRPLDQYPHVGLIDINLIAASTTDEIIQAVEELQGQGVEYFILDLQGNGGGLLDGGIEIARLFLEDGEIISQQFKGQDPKVYKVKEKGALAELPIAVLIDQNSASASEIIAGALQVHGRAPLIGMPSFGKNTVQLVFTLDDESSIHVTSAVWWLPGGSAGEPFKLIPDIGAGEGELSYEQVLELAVNYFNSLE